MNRVKSLLSELLLFLLWLIFVMTIMLHGANQALQQVGQTEPVDLMMNRELLIFALMYPPTRLLAPMIWRAFTGDFENGK